MNPPRVANRQHAVVLGVACIVAGSWLIHDAYDRRGHRRPWALSWLPGA